MKSIRPTRRPAVPSSRLSTSPRRATLNLSRSSAEGASYSMTIAASESSRNPFDVIKLGGGKFENYLRNPVVLWAHDDSALPIGRTTAIKRVGEKIKADFEFLPGDEMAERVRNAWDLGFIKAASIRFLPLDVDARGTVVEWDLLEWSLLPVPADPDALRKVARALKVPEEVMSRSTGRTGRRPKGRSERDALQRELDELLAYLRTKGDS